MKLLTQRCSLWWLEVLEEALRGWGLDSGERISLWARTTDSTTKDWSWCKKQGCISCPSNRDPQVTVRRTGGCFFKRWQPCYLVGWREHPDPMISALSHRRLICKRQGRGKFRWTEVYCLLCIQSISWDARRVVGWIHYDYSKAVWASKPKLFPSHCFKIMKPNVHLVSHST